MIENTEAAVRPDWQIQLLGEFSVSRGAQSYALPQGSQRLLAWLAVHPRAQPRSAVATRLWPDLDAERAGATLRTAVWTLRREVGIPFRPHPAGLQLDSRACVDLWRSVDRARLLPKDHPSVPSEALRPARATATPADDWLAWVDDFSRDLLPEWPEEWLVLHRERHRQIRLHALEDLCRLLAGTSQTAAAIEIALEAVAGDPLRESAQRLLIELHLVEGNPSEAIRQYRSYAAALRDQLGVPPSPELTSLLPLLHNPVLGSDGRVRSEGAPRRTSIRRAGVRSAAADLH